MTNYYRMSPRRNTSRRSGRQNFRNKSVSPRRSAIRKNPSRRSGRQNFSNKRVSPRRSARRTSNRRSGRQNFRNKRVGKERFLEEKYMMKYFIYGTGLVAFIVGILLVISYLRRKHNKQLDSNIDIE